MYKEYNINQIVLPLVLTLKIDPKDIAFAVSVRVPKGIICDRSKKI